MVHKDAEHDGSPDPDSGQNQMSDVTQILGKIESGDPSAAEELLPLIYDELRRLAAVRMAGEAPDNTLQPTALVHEAYIRMLGADSPSWNDRGHFFCAAAEAMRRILIDHARKKGRVKRGGGRIQVTLGDVEVGAGLPLEDLLALDEALSALTQLH